jgi:hypothetical protein
MLRKVDHSRFRVSYGGCFHPNLFLLKGLDVEKVDTTPVYWTGHALGTLIRELNSAPTVASLFPVAVAVRDHLDGFVVTVHRDGFGPARRPVLPITVGPASLPAAFRSRFP